ncbi:Zinc-binding protein [Vibrio chagasii]|uniref:zinc uptake protein ZrgA n=1 Tax=Vibrio chagasii TaxID=170679 RepID=UPI00337C3F7B|nr:Zinc-binding protein [Vibrio chagasii]CAH7092890.1 Zinc-binding protein [Vibrio chagasii]CAH7386493.1 Zinc-binding protein [Vibrio chagasii]CAH7395703.1 Zinc-binding protein [Vibrio chagasii]CAH7397085.1 Zinc-binding protein [Vibrio chagasii]
MKPSILAVVIGMTVSTNVLANEEFRSHGAHVHGQVEVNIAQDGQELLVEVTAPGADVVGFEHAPETAEQKKVFEQAIAQLNKPDELFSFNNANCTLKFKSVSNTLESDHNEHEGHDHEGHDHAKHDHDDHEGHDHAEHDHDDHKDHDHAEHDHDDHKDHDHAEHDHDDHEGHDHHDHEGHDHSEGGHGEFTVEYHYQCSDVAKLDTVNTQWFSKFSNTEKMTVNLLTDTAQVQEVLNAERISFRF